jgi:HEAT repeat protein
VISRPALSSWCRLLCGSVLWAFLSCVSVASAAQGASPLSNAGSILEDLARQVQDQSRPDAERLQLIKVLGDWGTAQVRASLLPLLKDPNPSIRAASARALGLPGDRESAAALRDRLEAPDETPAVRAAAVESLGRIGDDSVRAIVVAATRDPDNAVRGAALWGLTFGGLVNPADRTAFMRQIAEDRAMDPLMRSEAVLALGELKDRGAADLLMRLLESEPAIPMPLPGDNPTQQQALMIRYRQARDVRAWAAKSLGLLDARAALPLLLKSAEAPDDFFLRATSVAALVAWRVPEAVPVLVGRLADPFPDIRVMALKGLATTKDARVVDAVLARLAAETPTVRVQVIETLVELGDPRVRRELEAFRQSNLDPQVERALDKALAQLPR